MAKGNDDTEGVNTLRINRDKSAATTDTSKMLDFLNLLGKTENSAARCAAAADGAKSRFVNAASQSPASAGGRRMRR